MNKESNIKIFEEKQVRTQWDAEQEKWYVSIVDVIAILTESIDPNAYWRKLKQRLKEEDSSSFKGIEEHFRNLCGDGKMNPNVSGKYL